jgi:hypothetical protein
MVHKMIRGGKLVFVFGGQESQNYSKNESIQIRWFLVMARHKGGPVSRSPLQGYTSQAKAKGVYQAIQLANAESANAESANAESANAESANAESANAESVNAESLRTPNQ